MDKWTTEKVWYSMTDEALNKDPSLVKRCPKVAEVKLTLYDSGVTKIEHKNVYGGMTAGGVSYKDLETDFETFVEEAWQKWHNQITKKKS